MHLKILNEALWWKGRVRLKGHRLQPLHPLEPYNPFDFYYPHERGKQREKSIHFQFAKVDTSNPEAIRKFCERFGVLGDWAETWAKQVLTPIMRAPSFFKPLALGHQHGPAQAVEVLSEINQFLMGPPSFSWIRPMTLDEFRQSQSLFSLAIKYLQGPSEPSESSDSNSLKQAAGNLLSFHIQFVRPRLLWDTQLEGWKLTWDAPSLSLIFWVMLLLDVLGPGSILLCPQCGGPFLATRPRTRFCSPQCYNAFKVRDFYRKNPHKRVRAKKSDKAKALNNI